MVPVGGLHQLSKLVGIGGLLASGKDAVSDYLVEHHGWTKLGMSDALNDALLVINPLIPVRVGHASGHWRYSDLYAEVGYVEAKTNPEVRRLLQMLGTEVGREMIHQDVWTDIMTRKISIARTTSNVIVTGIRFENEVGLIGALGGDLWWVDRPGMRPPENTGAHSSETSISQRNFDLLIPNTGTLDDLYMTVEQAIG